MAPRRLRDPSSRWSSSSSSGRWSLLLLQTPPRLLPMLLLLLSARTCEAIAFANTDWTVVAGRPFALRWSGAAGPAGVSLINGTEGHLTVVLNIDSNDPGTSFDWTPPDGLPSGKYMFQISDDKGSLAYSAPFSYTSLAPSLSSASSSAPTKTNTTTQLSSSSSSAVAPTGAAATGPPAAAADDKNNTPAASCPRPDLSLAEKVGVGLGAGAAGLVCVAVAAFLAYRRGEADGLRRAARSRWVEVPPGLGGGRQQPKLLLETFATYAPAPTTTLRPRPPGELDGSNSSRSVVELQADEESRAGDPRGDGNVSRDDGLPENDGRGRAGGRREGGGSGGRESGRRRESAFVRPLRLRGWERGGGRMLGRNGPGVDGR